METGLHEVSDDRCDLVICVHLSAHNSALTSMSLFKNTYSGLLITRTFRGNRKRIDLSEVRGIEAKSIQKIA